MTMERLSHKCWPLFHRIWQVFYQEACGDQLLFFTLHGLVLLAFRGLQQLQHRGHSKSGKGHKAKGLPTRALAIAGSLAWNALFACTLVLFMRPWFR